MRDILTTTEIWEAYSNKQRMLTMATPAGIEEFRIGMWVRRKDQEGRPHGPILVVTGFAGWAHAGVGSPAKWTHNIQVDFAMSPYGYTGGLGGIDLSDGTMAYPSELFYSKSDRGITYEDRAAILYREAAKEDDWDEEGQ